MHWVVKNRYAEVLPDQAGTVSVVLFLVEMSNIQAIVCMCYAAV